MRVLSVLICTCTLLSAQLHKKDNELWVTGSDTMNNVMTLWAEAYYLKNPDINIRFQEHGQHKTGIESLTEGFADIGMMTRMPNKREIKAFKEKHKTEPILIVTAYDALAIFVRKENPLVERGLTFAEADAVFSSTRNRGYKVDITKWGQLVVNEAYTDKEIVVYSKHSATAMYGFFQKAVLGKGSYKKTVKEQPSGSVTGAVANDKFGICYSGIDYKTDSLAAVPIIADQKKVDCNYENTINATYPLSRKFFLILPPNPSQNVKKLITFVLSEEAQDIVRKAGYYPLQEKQIAKELEKLK